MVQKRWTAQVLSLAKVWARLLRVSVGCVANQHSQHLCMEGLKCHCNGFLDLCPFLLVQVSRWKRRAEELESLQRVVSSPEGSAFSSSNSETGTSHCTESVEPSVSPRASGPRLAAPDPATTPAREQKEERYELEEARHEAVTSSLRQELSEAKETLAMMEEEVATAVLAAREQVAGRVAAETRVKSLQVRKETRIGREGGGACCGHSRNIGWGNTIYNPP